MGKKYDAERAVGAAEGERHREEILAFMSDWNSVAKYLLTYRRDGRARMRPVNAYMVDGWHIQTVTQDLHFKTGHVRRDRRVGYLFSGMTPRDRENDPISIWVEGVAELIEDQSVVRPFLRWREEVTQTGFDAFRPLLAFFLTALVSLLGHALITLPLLLRLVAGVNPWRHYRAMSAAMLTAFSTASSSATLPLTMRCVESNAGVSNRTPSFVLPLGATVNMDGTALYECVAAMFLAQAYGLELSLTVQFTIVFVALVTSIGVAGIPAASLVAITIILSAIGLPIEAIGLILVTDRVLDMIRTSINVFSDSCGAVIIATTEGETGILADPPRPSTASS